MASQDLPLKRRAAQAARLGVRSMVARFQPSTTFNPPMEQPDRLEEIFTAAGVPVERWAIDPAGHEDFMERAAYPDWYIGGHTGGDRYFGQLTLEHYVALALTEPKPNEVLVDVGSNASPFIDVAERVAGVTAYEQDLQFAPGINGRRIGGSAAAMSAPDGFADVLVLASALAHFEREADTGFVREAARVLRPGGRAVAVPLYISDVYGAKVDPRLRWGGAPTERGMIRFLQPGLSMRFSRIYDPAHLRMRILEPADQAGFRTRVLRVIGGEELVRYSYLNFALLLERPGS